MGESKRRKQLDPMYGLISRKVYKRQPLFNPGVCRNGLSTRSYSRLAKRNGVQNG